VEAGHPEAPGWELADVPPTWERELDVADFEAAAECPDSWM